MSCGLLGRMRAYVSSVYTRRGWRAGVGERVLIKLLAIVCRAVCPQPPAPSSGGGAHVWYDCFFEETVEETLKLTATLVQGENDLRTFTENSQISTQRELGTRKLREKTPDLPAARAVAGEGGGV